MTETSGRVTLDIDTTMMEDTEVRIIESHLAAIKRVVEGAQPQSANVNLYVSEKLDNDEAERLAAIMSEALEHHGFARVNVTKAAK